jgi:hypothetical protein
MNTRPIILVAFALVACGGYPEPKDAQIKSEAAVRGAQEVGATKSPQATLYLKYATDQIAEAKKLIADGDNERAEGVLMRAKADAELALMLAKLDTEQKEAQDAQNQVTDMKKKLGK